MNELKAHMGLEQPIIDKKKMKAINDRVGCEHVFVVESEYDAHVRMWDSFVLKLILSLEHWNQSKSH